jgi:hypothetical protein
MLRVHPFSIFEMSLPDEYLHPVLRRILNRQTNKSNFTQQKETHQYKTKRERERERKKERKKEMMFELSDIVTSNDNFEKEDSETENINRHVVVFCCNFGSSPPGTPHFRHWPSIFDKES